MSYIKILRARIATSNDHKVIGKIFEQFGNAWDGCYIEVEGKQVSVDHFDRRYVDKIVEIVDSKEIVTYKERID